MGISSLPWLLLKTIKTEHRDLGPWSLGHCQVASRTVGGGKGREVGSQRPWRDWGAGSSRGVLESKGDGILDQEQMGPEGRCLGSATEFWSHSGQGAVHAVLPFSPPLGVCLFFSLWERSPKKSKNLLLFGPASSQGNLGKSCKWEWF